MTGSDSPETRSGQNWDPDELVTPRQIADRCLVSRNTFYGWRHTGAIGEPAERVGNIGRWRWADIEGLPVIRKALGLPQATDGGGA